MNLHTKDTVVSAIKFNRKTFSDIMKKYSDNVFRAEFNTTNLESDKLILKISNGRNLMLFEGDYILEFADGYITALSEPTMEHLFEAIEEKE